MSRISRSRTGRTLTPSAPGAAHPSLASGAFAAAAEGALPGFLAVPDSLDGELAAALAAVLAADLAAVLVAVITVAMTVAITVVPSPFPPSHGMCPMTDPSPPNRRREELRAFLLLSIVMAPVLALLAVAGYGFIVWMLQLLSGPPGPMH